MYGIHPRRQSRLRLAFAIGLGSLGVAILAVLIALPDVTFPSEVWLWALFSLAVVYFEWTSVEVNDRLAASPTVMVLMTAAVVFGDEALLGVTAMVALGFVTPADIKNRQWFQPAVNLGQLTLAASLAMLTLGRLLPEQPYQTEELSRIALASGVAAVVYGFVNFQVLAVIVRSVYGQRQVRPWSNSVALILPLLGMGFLGGLLGATYHLVGSVTLPLIFIVFFVGHMTFASYAQLREAQESTLRGFIKALEAKDLYTRGHTERVAFFSELIGREMGFNGTQLERLRWAALIHDVGKLAVPRDLIRKKARLTEEEYSQMQEHVHLVERLLAEVDFLQPMVAIAANHHAHYDGNGYTGKKHDHTDNPPLEACILAVADSFDAMTSTRSYRVALSQEYAIAELRRFSGTQFDPEVVEAFVDVLARRRERYGSPDVNSESEARRRAEGLKIDG